jgi:hypothetical protein
VEHAEKREPSRQKESQKLDAPMAALGKSTEEPASSSDHRPAPSAPASGLDVQILAQSGEGATTGPSRGRCFMGRSLPRRLASGLKRKKRSPRRRPIGLLWREKRPRGRRW